MSKLCKQLFLAAGLLTLAAGAALADGDGGDNSMSQWTGDSYAAFNGGNVGHIGDFYTHRERRATALSPAEEPSSQAVAVLSKRGHPRGRALNPFRDDTAG